MFWNWLGPTRRIAASPRAANTCRQGQRDFGEANGRAKQEAGRGHDFTAAGWWHSVCKFRRQRRHEAVVESAEFLLRPPFCSSAGQLESFQKSFLYFYFRITPWNVEDLHNRRSRNYSGICSNKLSTCIVYDKHFGSSFGLSGKG